MSLNSNKSYFFITIAIIISVLFAYKDGYAEEDAPPNPVYIAEQGDTLWGISQRFHVKLADILDVNHWTNSHVLKVGEEVIIPGYEGISGILETTIVNFGENIQSLSIGYGISKKNLVKLNHLTSPYELYAGDTLVIPSSENEPREYHKAILKNGETLLEIAMRSDSSVWKITIENEKSSTNQLQAGDEIYLLSRNIVDDENGKDQPITYAMKRSPLIQGRTLEVIVKVGDDVVNVIGDFDGKKLKFWPGEENQYIALQGIYAMLQPGLYPLNVGVERKDGASIGFTQAVYVEDGNYPYDPPLIVNSETVDPDVTSKENEKWQALFQGLTEKKYWQGKFQSPVSEYFSNCFPSRFGNRRSYNGGPYIYFHTGLDFCGQVGNDIYAPAKGVVVFTGNTIVRGNATVIDHGWGVFTAYLHQSEILVKEGDIVNVGDLIGKVGATGRVTGPHLHWEIWVNGYRVDPLEWLNEEFP